MVEKLQNIIKPIESQYGKLELFAVLKMDEIVDKWSLVFAAEWIPTLDEKSRTKLFDTIFTLVHKKLTAEEGASIARIGLTGPQSHMIQELKKLSTEKNINHLRDVKVNGNIVHDGYILKA